MKFSFEANTIQGYFRHKILLYASTVSLFCFLYLAVKREIATTLMKETQRNNGQRRLQTILLNNLIPKQPSRQLQSQSSSRPIMYTYVDYHEPYIDENLVKLWYASWKEAGWDVILLTHKDAQKYKLYNDYVKLLDEKNICCLPRQSYLRHIAMCAVESDGGYYSEVFTFPLHQINSSAESTIPNNGKITIHDGMLGSIISGNKIEWERMANLLFQPANINKNAMMAIRTILETNLKTITSPLQESIFEVESSNLIQSFFDTANVQVCNNANDQFIIRFHDMEITNQAQASNTIINDIKIDRSKIIENWMTHYKTTCWYNNTTTASSNNNSPITLKDTERTIISKTEHYKKIIDSGETTKPSQITCDDVSCKVTNACIDPTNGILKIVSTNDDHYKELYQKLSTTMLAAWVCTNCNRIMKVEKMNEMGQIWSPVATLSVGIDINNCGHHLGDVIWPLIRLHLKFRNPQDLIENGIGFLFLQAPLTPCDTIYHSIAEQVIRYASYNRDNIVEESSTMCFENVYLGTYKMNFMSSSGVNMTFLPYDNFHRDMYAMKSLFYNTYGLGEDVPKDTILITQKRKGYGKLRALKYHNLANIPQIINMIQTNYPNKYKIQIISWEDYNMKQQVHIMSKTKLIISLPGSAIMNGFLLQNTSSLLCYCQVGEVMKEKDDARTYYNTKGIKFQKSNEFLLWFDHFGYGNFEEICDEPYTYIHGLDTIVNVDELNKKMHELAM